MAKTILLGCGLPKTGTRSLCAALSILGIRAQHDRHFFTNRTPAKIAHAVEASDFEAFLDWPHPLGVDYQASTLEVVTIGKPPFRVGAEPDFARVATLLPSSRLILTTRNRDSWLDSCLLHVLHSRAAGSLDWTDIDTRAMKHEWDELHNHAHRWRAHHPDRMLLYEVSSGWEPLCGFLGRPVPSVAFPRENTASRRLLEVLHHYAVRDRHESLPDDECRKCHRRGWKADEFTSPLTGLCTQCTKGRPQELQDAVRARINAATSFREEGL